MNHYAVTTYTIYAGLATKSGDTSALVVYHNRSVLQNCLDTHLGAHGYTLQEGTGSYKGSVEPTAIITVIGHKLNPAIEDAVLAAAEAYRKTADQNEVWILHDNNHLCVVN